jgi:hypothetical protein
MNRGRSLLLAQRLSFRGRKLAPLGAPPDWLDADEVRAWCDIVGAAPDVLRISDGRALAVTSSYLARWQSGCRDPEYVNIRELYRQLGLFFLPMRELRRLLFPERMRPR